jgi:hypothetical protein
VTKVQLCVDIYRNGVTIAPGTVAVCG